MMAICFHQEKKLYSLQQNEAAASMSHCSSMRAGTDVFAAAQSLLPRDTVEILCPGAVSLIQSQD